MKIVRKRLASGEVKVYRYDPADKKKGEAAEANRDAMAKLGQRYMASPEFRSLSASAQVKSRHYLNVLATELDWMTFSDLNDRSVRGDFYDLRDLYADRPAAADKLMAVLRRLLSWAYERGSLGVEVNHAIKISKLVPPGRNRRDFVWFEDAEAAFIAAAGAPLQRLYWGALYTALRRGDLIRLRWGEHFDGRWIVIRPSKTAGTTQAEVHLPVHEMPPLAALIAELPRTSPFMFTNRAGSEWSPTNANNRFYDACDKAEISDLGLHWHDIRGTAVTRMLAAGCTDAEVAAITGHALGGGTMLGAYASRTRDLATHAYRKWAAHIAREPEVIQFPGNRAQKQE